MKKYTGRDDKSINVVNSNISNSFNTYFNIDLVHKLVRYFRITFKKNEYYEDFLNQINIQLHNKLKTQKHHRKYIPEIYLELNNAKEYLRILTQPFLFLSKILEDINKTDLSFFNSVFNKAGFLSQKLTSNLDVPSISTFNKLEFETTKILLELKNTLKNIPDLEKVRVERIDLSEEDKKFIVRHESTQWRFKRLLEEYIKYLSIINEVRLIIFTEKAGQGKTNLLCDFIDSVIIKKSIPAIFLSGNEFVNIKNESIESIILEKVLPLKTKIPFSDFMADIETICNKQKCTFTIFIDALNENNDIGIFRDKLYTFTEKMLDYKFVRLVFTCRTEYYSERFSNFLSTSFDDSKKIISGFSKQ